MPTGGAPGMKGGVPRRPALHPRPAGAWPRRTGAHARTAEGSPRTGEGAPRPEGKAPRPVGGAPLSPPPEARSPLESSGAPEEQPRPSKEAERSHAATPRHAAARAQRARTNEETAAPGPRMPILPPPSSPVAVPSRCLQAEQPIHGLLRVPLSRHPPLLWEALRRASPPRRQYGANSAGAQQPPKMLRHPGPVVGPLRIVFS